MALDTRSHFLHENGIISDVRSRREELGPAATRSAEHLHSLTCRTWRSATRDRRFMGNYVDTVVVTADRESHVAWITGRRR